MTVVAGLAPTRGAWVGIVALVLLVLLDRLPLEAYRPRPRRCPPRSASCHREESGPPRTVVRRVDRPGPEARETRETRELEQRRLG